MLNQVTGRWNAPTVNRCQEHAEFPDFFLEVEEAKNQNSCLSESIESSQGSNNNIDCNTNPLHAKASDMQAPQPDAIVSLDAQVQGDFKNKGLKNLTVLKPESSPLIELDDPSPPGLDDPDFESQSKSVYEFYSSQACRVKKLTE